MNNSSAFDFGKALTYMFDEQDWIRKGAIALLMIVLSVFILPAFLLPGYQLQIVRNVMRGQRPILPEWEGRWNDYFFDGIKVTVASFVYSLPAVLLFCAGYIPIIIGTTSDSQATGSPIALLGLCLLCLGLVFLLPLLGLYYVGLIRFAQTGDFSSFFKVGALIAFARRHSSVLLMALLASLGASVISSFIPFVGSVWGMFATGHALGQAARATTPEGGAESAVYAGR